MIAAAWCSFVYHAYTTEKLWLKPYLTNILLTQDLSHGLIKERYLEDFAKFFERIPQNTARNGNHGNTKIKQVILYFSTNTLLTQGLSLRLTEGRYSGFSQSSLPIFGTGLLYSFLEIHSSLFLNLACFNSVFKSSFCCISIRFSFCMAMMLFLREVMVVSFLFA